MNTAAIHRLNAALEGRYRIERELGEGGMATVYLADDLRHERQVALKVLKPELAAVVGAERFLAEIKTTANLQHPHILPLHDSGEADGFLYYVMPYIEGETLSERLQRERQLPVDEAVRIATDVAEALHAAHEQGVIHRDIKPANILLSRGRPLVADFGIALAVSAAGGGRLTETGLSMGTPYYMSPEQASADREPSAASDVYSLGCVLYEMLLGEPPHTGGSAQAVLAKILTGETPKPSAGRASIPSNVDAAIRKALERLPADRFTRAQDFATALGDAAFRHGPAPVGGRATPNPWIGVAAAMTVVAATAGIVATWSMLRRPPLPPVERFTLPYDLANTAPALSPDGSAILIRGEGPTGDWQLWLRSWDDLTLRPVVGTEGVTGAGAPVFSPRGDQIAFVAGGQLKVASIAGGSVRTLADSVFCCPRWEENGWVYFTGRDRNIERVPSTGGGTEAVTELAPEGDAPHSDFVLAPGGEVGLFSRWGANPGIEAISLSTGERTDLTPGMRPYLTSGGHLVYASSAGQILAARFGADPPALADAPVILVEGVQVTDTPYPIYAVSRSGTLVYQTGGAATLAQPVWMSRAGEPTPVDPNWVLHPPPSANFGWSLSPDDSRLAMWLREADNDDIWIKTLPTGPLSRLTFDPARDLLPRWMPNGERVTFVSERRGGLDLWVKNADGTGDAELVVDLERELALGVWSEAGEWLILRVAGRAGFTANRDILALRVDADEAPHALVATEATEQAPSLSPDGRWLAYSSNQTGQDEIFVQPFPDVDQGRWQVSTAGGIRPIWAHSGMELFYVNGSRELVAAKIETDPRFAVVERAVLFEIPPGYIVTPNGDFYDVSADDERFLMARPYDGGSEAVETPEVVLVQNWGVELRRLVRN